MFTQSARNTFRRLSIPGFLFVSLATSSAVQAEDSVRDRPWWAGMSMGYGYVSLSSDQSPGDDQGTFAFSLHGGRKLGRNVRIGFEVGGWLLEAGNLHDPMVGRGVGAIGPFVDLFPSKRIPIFLHLGAGWADYTSSRPLDFGSSGWAWWAGLGYEFPVGNRVTLSPRLRYASGQVGDVHNPIVTETGREYAVWECSASLDWHLGQPTTSNR